MAGERQMSCEGYRAIDLGAKGVVVKVINSHGFKGKIIKKEGCGAIWKWKSARCHCQCECKREETKPHIEATGADGAEIGTGSQQDEVRLPKSGLQRRKRRLHRFGIISLNCLLKKRRMAIVIMKMAMTALWIVMMVTTLWT
ncbi:unnamed protein product [Miscanthus lutarioriparius]|uniref:Uncharacterized protein n=1 Tax=Miscanthus lutarioriparius TaxID=422564 RepID=A0A811QIZ5_9POAL|nr:unnamed protein product [Miscanthus lutarioriparius]